MKTQNNLVRVGDKVFAKTLTFGNRKQRTVHVNRKSYRRNPKYKYTEW